MTICCMISGSRPTMGFCFSNGPYTVFSFPADSTKKQKQKKQTKKHQKKPPKLSNRCREEKTRIIFQYLKFSQLVCLFKCSHPRLAEATKQHIPDSKAAGTHGLLDPSVKCTVSGLSLLLIDSPTT